MQLHTIDLGIILVYLLITILIGVLMSKRASHGLDSYFLGDRAIPWYILGLSNASGMFDITGTMWLVYLLFVYGLKSAWLPWLWPIFTQIFLMVYLSIWLRRSNVLTGAEWIRTRFGNGRGARLAHISVVVFALVSVVGFLAYAFQGIGKFAAQILPWDLAGLIPFVSSANMYALFIMGITSIYVISGGMFGVVVTEVLQFFIMTVASIAVGIIAMNAVSPDMLAKVIPEGWTNIFFGWRLELDWSGILNAANTKIEQDGFSLFTIIFMMMMFKGIFVSMAGPAPNFEMQRILAAKSPKEAGLMSGFVNVALFFPRYMMIAGLTVLALVFFLPELRAMGGNVDFEMVLPYAIQKFIPVGLMGVLLAGLLSAFMSTFAATVNAAPAYIVNDLYKRYMNPQAGNRRLVIYSKIVALLVVLLGMGFGLIIDSINSATLWLVSALWSGYAAANVLKWYWWRFNGYGYFWGMLSGFIAALALPRFVPDVSALTCFPIILAISTLFCILGSLFSRPESDEVLMSFYQRVRPWGCWRPIDRKVLALHPEFKKNTNFGRDCANIGIGLVWQVALIALPIFLVIKQWLAMVMTLAVIGLTTFLLKINWLDKLENE